MLEADLLLKNNAFPEKKKIGKKNWSEESCYHFIGYMPMNGRLWTLDGLESQPQSQGRCLIRPQQHRSSS